MMVFFMGFATHGIVTAVFDADQIEQIPVIQPQVIRKVLELESPVVLKPEEMPSPYDWIQERDVHLYPDRVVIKLDNPQWSTYTDTNSMDPVIDESSHGIQIIPTSPRDVHIGDIISYQPDDFDGVLIHRVISVGNDAQGWYAVVKGDNNPYPDPNKVRFDQIRRVLVMIIY